MFDSYKRITIVSFKSATVYFDGQDGEHYNNPVFQGAFQLQINNDETDTAKRGLIATEDDSAIVDIVNLGGGANVRIDDEPYYYQTIKLVEADGGENVSEDWIREHEMAVQPSNLSVNFAQVNNDIVYANDGISTATEYQMTFYNGYQIVTATKIVAGNSIALPVGSNRVEVFPSVNPVILPVRAKDIANDSGQILDTVEIAGTSGTISNRIQNLDGSGRIIQIDSTEDTNTYLPVKQLSLALSSYDNYDLPDGSLFDVVGVTSPFSTTFTGFLAESGRQVTFFATPDLQITFKHEDTSSTANNRFNFPSSSDVVLRDFQTATFVYIDAENRWYLQSKT